MRWLLLGVMERFMRWNLFLYESKHIYFDFASVNFMIFIISFLIAYVSDESDDF